jgi:hypothetical protein
MLLEKRKHGCHYYEGEDPHNFFTGKTKILDSSV